jgi:hypothetical protein
MVGLVDYVARAASLGFLVGQIEGANIPDVWIETVRVWLNYPHQKAAASSSE